MGTQEVDEVVDLPPVLLLPPGVLQAAPLQQLQQQAQLGHLLLGLLGLALSVLEPDLGRAGRPGVQAELGDEPVVSSSRRPEVAGRDPCHDADLWGGARQAGLVVLHPARQQVLPQASVGAGQPPHNVRVGSSVTGTGVCLFVC